MESSRLPTTVDEARRWLATAEDLKDVSRLHDLAEAAQRYAQSREAQNYAGEVKLLAARRGGEMLQQVGRVPRGQARKDAKGVSTELVSTLENAGLSPMTAHRWQRVASISPEDFEGWIAAAKTQEDAEVTLAGILRFAIRPSEKECKERSFERLINAASLALESAIEKVPDTLSPSNWNALVRLDTARRRFASAIEPAEERYRRKYYGN